MPNAFSTLTTCANPPMVIVTTALDGERAGCLVGFHAQSSIDPPRYCVWLSKANHTARVAQRATHLAVHFVSTDQYELAERFGTLTGDVTDKFSGLRVTEHDGGAPVLDGLPHYLVLRRVALLDEGGDHLCITGEVVEAHAGGDLRPLRLSRVTHLEAGHDSDERDQPPTERARSPKATPQAGAAANS